MHRSSPALNRLLIPLAVLLWSAGPATVARAEPFALVITADTQYYSAETPRKHGKIAMFDAQVQWVIDNKDSKNIAFVLHAGDIVNNHDPTVGEWQRARPVLKRLDGIVPYALALGNHDLYTTERSAWEFNIFFPFRDFQDWPSLGGTFDATAGVLNAYYLFQAGGLDWLIFALEPFPRDAVLAWVDRVAETHPNHNTIMVTHSHVYPDDTLVGSSPDHMYTSTEYGVNPADGSGNNGIDVWNKCLRKHKNVLMTFNGHVGGDDLEASAGLVLGTGDHGNTVYQMCADYQETWYYGLFGHLRIITVDPELRTISVQTYSPYMDDYGTGPRSQFSFSDVAFTPAGPNATVTAPKGVVWWQAGTEQTVTWTTERVDGMIDIDLTTDGGTTWSSLASDVEDSGTCTITVPDTPSTRCLVRVSGTCGSPTETSNAHFVISRTPQPASITVGTPYQWATWAVGTQQSVGWTSQGWSGNVNVDISTDGGATWSSLAADTEDTGLLNVVAPDTPSAHCLVRVSGASGSPSGMSGDFEITRPEPETVEPPSGPSIPARYVMPSAQGAGDGTSWGNAAALSSIDAMVAAAGAGGTIYLRADAGDYVFGDDPAWIAHGGTQGNPVTIIGVDGSLVPTKAVMVGSRTRWTLPDDPEQVTDGSAWAVGQIIFRLAQGADNLTFRFLDFQHTGHPFHLTAPTHTNITVEDCSAYNFRRFFEHRSATSHIGTVIRRVTGIGFSKTAIRIRGDSHDVLLEDVFLNSGRQDGDNWATGVELNETAHDVTMINVTAKNCYWTSWNDPNRFWNADGFSSERGNYNITRINCVSSGNTDAGFDDKGENIRNINCTASDNNTNYKFWGSTHINENCKALDPAFHGGTIGNQQYWLAGEADELCLPGHAGQLTIKGGEIRDDDPETYVLVTEGSNAQIRVLDVTIEKHPDATQEFSFGGTGSVFLYGSLADKIPPTITSASTMAALANVPQAHLLQADEPVTWSIVGGPDAAAFSLVPSHHESTLKIAPFAEGSRQVVVRARDAANNCTDQTITVKIDAEPTVFMTDDFNRPDQDLVTDPHWRFIEGYGAPSDVRLRGGKLSIFNAEFNGILYGSPDIGFSDHYVQVRVASVPSQAGGAICARAYDTWHLIGVQFSDAGIQLLSRSNGDWKQLAKADEAPTVGDVLRLEVRGSDATVKKNGAVILGPVPTGGVGDGATRQGILSCTAAVDPWIDDYEVGTL